MQIPEPQIKAKLISIGHIETGEMILLTGGLSAIQHEESYVRFYPVLLEGKVAWSEPVRLDNFRTHISERKIEVVGIKEITKYPGGEHWRWAPHSNLSNPPHNNPCYRWQFVSTSIKRAIENGKKYTSLGWKAPEVLSRGEMELLALHASRIVISLHQLNFAVVNMATYFQNELVMRLNDPDRGIGRYSHIRSLDLVAHVHSFFQSFSAARDHYAHFLAVQISRSAVRTTPIDDMNRLLSKIDLNELRVLPIIRALEQKKLLCVEKNEKGPNRLVFCAENWLSYSNALRRRFTHHAPYGTAPGEDMTEVYPTEKDPSLLLVKAFLDKEDGDAFPDVFRTVNGLYQNICGLFLSAADFTAYETDPPTIVV